MTRQERRVARARRALVLNVVMQIIMSLLFYTGQAVIDPDPRGRIVVWTAFAVLTVVLDIVLLARAWRRAPLVVRPPAMPLSLERVGDA